MGPNWPAGDEETLATTQASSATRHTWWSQKGTWAENVRHFHSGRFLRVRGDSTFVAGGSQEPPLSTSLRPAPQKFDFLFEGTESRLGIYQTTHGALQGASLLRREWGL